MLLDLGYIDFLLAIRFFSYINSSIYRFKQRFRIFRYLSFYPFCGFNCTYILSVWSLFINAWHLACHKLFQCHNISTLLFSLPFSLHFIFHVFLIDTCLTAQELYWYISLIESIPPSPLFPYSSLFRDTKIKETSFPWPVMKCSDCYSHLRLVN